MVPEDTTKIWKY